MALFGQARTQAVQHIHLLKSTTAFLSTIPIAPVPQTPVHFPHPTHSSSLTKAFQANDSMDCGIAH